MMMTPIALTTIGVRRAFAQVSPSAVPVLRQLADILKPFPNPLRIEGYTDDMPIATTRFPSNWELSAARAASVVHLFMETGVEPTRMSVADRKSTRLNSSH